MEQRLRRRLKPTNDSWRVDETYIRVKGKWVYLYRAVDSTGATIDFLLSAKRDVDAVERFLAKALGGENHPAPRVINTDKHAAYPPGHRGAQSWRCSRREDPANGRYFIEPIIVRHIAGPVVENCWQYLVRLVTAETDLPTPNSASFDSQQSIVAAVTSTRGRQAYWKSYLKTMIKLRLPAFERSLTDFCLSNSTRI